MAQISFRSHILTSAILLQQLQLCSYCRAREGLKAGGKNHGEGECYLCKGTLAQLPSIAKEILERIKDYEFDTFLIGASIPQSILDAEDELRSRLKIKGVEGIKSQITKVLSRKIASTLGKKIDYSRPDLTILVSPADSTITISPRSVWLRARYQKYQRGIPQRSMTCNVCNGLGCAQCEYSGRSGSSVQGLVSAFLMKSFVAEACNFVWLGSEDENSLVKGSGRPFYIEIVKPKKRKRVSALSIKGRKKGSKPHKLSGVKLLGVEVLDRRIASVPQFEIAAAVNLVKKPEAPPLEQSRLDALESNAPNQIVTVRLSRKSRTVQKRIESIKTKVSDGGERLQLLIKCDGGIPLRKLVTGRDYGVEPNLSELLSSYEIDPSKPFDILDVKVKSSSRAALAQSYSDRTEDYELPEAEDLNIRA